MRDFQHEFEVVVRSMQFEHMKVDLTRDPRWPETYKYEETNKAWTYFMYGVNVGMTPEVDEPIVKVVEPKPVKKANKKINSKVRKLDE